MSYTSDHDAFDGHTLDLVIPGSLDGVRVDRVLAMLTGLSRSQASEIVHAGALSVNGQPVVKPATVLEEGDHLYVVVPPRGASTVAPDGAVEIRVVLDDPDFVVVNKLPGQVVHPGAGQRDATLVAGLLARYPELQELSAKGLCESTRPGIVHRLDKGTSGLLVVAKTPRGLASLASQLRDRSMERTYLGMVQGHVVEERGVVDAPIGRSTRVPTMMTVRSDGRPARTHYEVLARSDVPYAASLLRLKLDTGRTHQIRVHLATIGHPVVNDLRYGHRREPRLGEERVFLHSTSLVFTHPRRDERVATHAPLPDDLANVVREDT